MTVSAARRLSFLPDARGLFAMASKPSTRSFVATDRLRALPSPMDGTTGKRSRWSRNGESPTEVSARKREHTGRGATG